MSGIPVGSTAVFGLNGGANSRFRSFSQSITEKNGCSYTYIVIQMNEYRYDRNVQKFPRRQAFLIPIFVLGHDAIIAE